MPSAPPAPVAAAARLEQIPNPSGNNSRRVGLPAAGDGAAAGRQAASEVLVARGGRFLGTIRVGDAVRPEATGALRALRRINLILGHPA